MPRYRFTAKDLEPLAHLIGRPDAQRLLERAIPVKRFNPAPRKLEQVPADLPVKVQDRNHPDGLPLADRDRAGQEARPRRAIGGGARRADAGGLRRASHRRRAGRS